MLFNWTKTLHLVRGLPGEGKSTLALALVGGDDRKLVENDDFWFVPRTLSVANMAHKGPYERVDRPYAYAYDYSIELTHLAANWCGAEAFRRLRIFDEVAVANTFVRREYLMGYIEQARKVGVRVLIHRPQTAWVGDVTECDQKNVHAVPVQTIERMRDQWEDMTQQEVDVLLNLPSELRTKLPSSSDSTT